MAAVLAIEATELVKSYGGKRVVDGVSLAVPAGTVLGLLGPNGAGKTTVVRMLSTLLRPDGGHARVGGFDVATEADGVRRLIGVTGQSTSVDGDLSGEQNLIMIGRLLGLSRRAARSRAAELLEQSGLTEAARKQAKAYSGGMRRRLDLAMSMLGRPAVVFLDEPTTGLDPARRGESWAMIRCLAARGAAVLLTTQYLEEADNLADRMVVIDRGAVIAEGTSETLKRRLGIQHLDMQLSVGQQLDAAAAVAQQILGTEPVIDLPNRRVSVAVGTPQAMPAVVRALDDAGISIDELQLRLPSLDDVFLTLTGHTTGAPESPDGMQP
jgi:daunorubicin resistance ABC transporter ATP-binding subunit